MSAGEARLDLDSHRSHLPVRTTWGRWRRACARPPS
ncbi:hypothetical protein SFR_0969 [Streptomyces sp. FR-008]|nr:hypothetical protein SFR_0969 [Streptomyces sp. FR-008]